MARQIIIYGLGGADKQYVTVAYQYLKPEYISASNIRYIVDTMKRCPEVKEIYMLDNSLWLKKAYMDSIREHSIESCMIFKDLLQREGQRLY